MVIFFFFWFSFSSFLARMQTVYETLKVFGHPLLYLKGHRLIYLFMFLSPAISVDLEYCTI